ncbi:MAG: indole-3-glycerol phosphate synthase TrpC [Phycisphaeraceae bacterium]|nr:indole-3-glycerol phosphate synthase TrpC [Phycisphaeraceae bacterium]
MTDVLARIVEHKRQEIAAAKQARPLEGVREAALATTKPRNFFAALTRPPGELRVIAEVKKASPSGGLIREDFQPVELALAYQRAGAAAISCLTDEKFFQGSLAYLRQIKDAVDIPVLRKDFIVDTYQVYEARAAGADAILLIAECLDEALLIDLMILSTELQMTTLLEVHEVESLLRVRPHIGFPHPGYALLGVNNRNLRTMSTDIRHTMRMLEMIEDPSILVAESGIKTPDDVARLRAAGVHRILVGEHLMRQPDVEQALRDLMRSPAA